MSRPSATTWFPLAPLAALAGLTENAIAVKFGLNSTRVTRRGINEYQADHLAVRLGHHPAEIWPEWIP